MLIFPVSVASSAEGETALSLSAGIDALRGQFVSGTGPKTNGNTIDYMYFAPKNGDADTKYPLVIFMHGMSEGSYPGEQIKKNETAYWSSAEFQSRFTGSGGAYILAARSPEENGNYWYDGLTGALKAAIDDFIANHSDVDTSRIYIAGWCVGGRMVYKMVSAYPEFFAAAVPICPYYEPTDSEISKAAYTPIWLVASTKDPVVPYYGTITNTWSKIKNHSTQLSSCRLSTMGTVYYPGGSKASTNHSCWPAVMNDMFTSSGGDYYDMSTENGNGDTVRLVYPEGMISWMSAQHNSSGETQKCTCQCHSSNFFVKLVWFFKVLIWRITGDDSHRYCACGEAHW